MSDDPISPHTAPFVDALPIPAKKEPQAFPASMPTASAGEGECGRDDHQAWAAYPPQKFYELRVREGQHRFHRDYPLQTIWGFDGTSPGPTFHARYGESALVRIHNDLPPDTTGFGSPEIATHLHNLHSPSESDGYPGDFFSATNAGPTVAYPGGYRDHHYLNMLAGDDPREALGTLWYHDHRMDFTAANSVRGLAGFYLLFDELDSGDETDANPAALRLPSGAFDVPLMLQDRFFDEDGHVYFNQFDTEGLVGDKICVNGKILPHFRVQPRKYRLRFLDAGPLRFYDLVLTYNGVRQPFSYIGNDGNLLGAPLTQYNVRIGVAERADVVVDFSRYPLGARLFLRNRLEQLKGRGPSGQLLHPGANVMRFDVVEPLAAPDPSRVPAVLRPQEPLTELLSNVKRLRRFRFKRDNNIWVVNNEIFDPEVPLVTVRRGETEIWELESNGNWSHPVHIHLEEARILSRNGAAPAPHERGRKDVFVLRPDERMRIAVRFRDFVGKYVCHCHNLTHEDHAMMFRFDVVP